MTIEFLPPDDETSTGPPPGPPGPRPGRRRWWALGAVVLVAATVGWVLTRPTTRAPVPRAAVASPTFSAVRPAPTATTSRCHGAPFCAASLLVPQALRQVLQQYLPTAISSLRVQSFLAQSLVTGGDYLSDREIDVVAGSVQLLLTVHRIVGPVPAGSAIVTAPLGTGSAVIHRRTTAFVIDLQYLAPETVPPELDRLRVLAVDPRLEAL